MAITALGTLKEQVRDKLAYLTTVVNASTAVGHTDVNHDAEDLYCGLLNLAFDWNISNTNDDQMNSAAIDLADKDADTLLGRGEKGVALQVTSTVERKKVEHTLTKFAEHNLQSQYKRLIILMIGQKRGYQGEFTLPAGLDFKKTRDIWDTDDLTRELHALSQPKLEAINKYLTEQLPIWQEKAKKPELNLPLPMTMEEDRFIGREEELAEIRAKLEQSSVVYLTGLGGMGKTELAIKFGRKYRDGEVYFVRFQESFQRTVSMNVAQGIEGLLEQGPEVARNKAMKRLGQCSKHDILIIDNADAASGNFADLEDNTWTALRQLPMKLLITTRCDVAGAVKVGAMKTELLRQLFRNQELELTTQQMDDLIDAVKGHTMMVDMMAKTLSRNPMLEPEELLQAMRDGTLSEQDYRDVATEKDGTLSQEQIYIHLSKLFTMAKLTDMDMDILGDLILLPESGLSLSVLKVYSKEEIKHIYQLIDAGWLNLEPKTKRVTMHPVVRLVCREELKPDDENCGNFLNAVWSQYDRKKYDAALFRQWAELFSQAADLLPDREGEWAITAGYFWIELVQSDNALKYNLLAVKQREENLPGSNKLATAYNNVGLTYSRLGDHKQALKYHQKALSIFEKVLPSEHPDLATSYSWMGDIHGKMGDHPKALEYQLKALVIYEKTLPLEHPFLATSYNNVGGTYGDLGDHKQALKYHQKALSIFEKVLPSEHPDLATSYSWMGDIHGKMGDHPKALEYQLKALVIYEKTLPLEHPFLATSYNNVGGTYGNLGDHQKELEYQLKALAIREKVLPPEHPDLARSYNNVGVTYGNQGDHQKAQEYQLKALAIREKVLPPEHPDLAASYNNVGYTYGRLGDYETALDYAKWAVSIGEKSLPEGHPDKENYRLGVLFWTYMLDKQKQSQ